MEVENILLIEIINFHSVGMNRSFSVHVCSEQSQNTIRKKVLDFNTLDTSLWGEILNSFSPLATLCGSKVSL